MSRRGFVVLTNGATAEQQMAIASLAQASNYGWWHHFPQGWLFYSDSADVTTAVIRDQIRAMCPTLRTVVLEAKFDTWSSFALPGENEWLVGQWNSPTWPTST